MRNRLFIASSIAIATVGAVVLGGATAAQAGPYQGPGDMAPPKQTTTTVAPPKDKYAPKPSPTTTTPPKGPGDLAPAPKDEDDGPQGPGDLAPAPKDEGPKGPGDIADAPKDDNDVEPGPDTTGNGSGSDNYTPPADDGSDTEVEGTSVDAESDDSTDSTDTSDSTEDAAAKSAATDSDRMPPFVIIFMAALVAGMIAFVAARRRGDGEDAEQA